MKRFFALHTLAPLASIALLGCTTTGPSADPDYAVAEVSVATAEAQTASLDDIIAAVDIPYETFTLNNGLTTIVHTDRKSPLVGVTVYYRVGSKSEPRGRTGFAHLFEHIMFTGSENVENFDIPLEAAGSTGTNGSTSYDRTNYVETVPTGALDLALMMEADRMGYLLGALSQERLDNQRAVVQNEKRQGDNQPYGLIDYKLSEGLLPVGHPYRHSVIGSMADLSAASLADVRSWFTENYGPNNVVLALTGDIDAETARPMVERWFGDIPRGPEVEQFEAGPVTLAQPAYETMTDQVPQTLLLRAWTGPDMQHPDAVPLQVGMHILGGLASSRLDNAMVRGEELATSVSAYYQAYEQIGFAQAQVQVRPDASQDEAQALLEAEIARLIDNGPTQDELERATTQIASDLVGSLERIGGFGGKGAILAEGLLYTGDADFYRTDLERMAALTPVDVQAAMERWLTRPAYNLAVVPGERTLDGGEMGGWGDEHLNPAPEADSGSDVEVTRTGPDIPLPRPEPVGELTFPEVERATLSNGIEVVLARRDSVPKVSLALVFDAGSVVDPQGQAGVHATMVDLLTEGTTSRSALDIAVEEESLGASLSVNAGAESTTAFLSALSPNLRPSLELMADVVRNPAFAPDAMERVRSQRLAAVAQELSSPAGLANRAFMPLVYGERHPYAAAATSGNAEVIEALTRADMVAEHAEWIRSATATITAVGDVTMDELVADLEATLGDWQDPATPVPAKDVSQPPASANAPRIVVVDRPNSPSSYLVLGRPARIAGWREGMEALDLANEVIGDGFLSRLNNDLRETKGWTYGIRSSLPDAQGPRIFRIATQVQADRTADSIQVILDQLEAFPATRPVDEVELQRVTDGNVRNLPNRYETNGQVLGALLANQNAGRDDRYQVLLPQLYAAVDADDINAAARDYLQPENITIVVVGDRETVEPQLENLDMDVQYVAADSL
ncbi:M16 family metallopeptidase [Aurantiacibacter poecillastricola]|uniref:M16 family metallopeptidase n=1 Tax=Aurantiacibacter poecillastricola TaxID=3064385 RepID=UPI00273F42B6|nr:pitrilysin family protein [Aurantiacibacter sp. 219JJ12-13]MDP5262813.1 pitrilysin family protein [Aurantiacibacter sp. 219JJ12-13]